jgi:putative transposase
MKYAHLPHIDNLNYYQFTTFRTDDSTDDFLAHLPNKKQSNQQYQLACDKYLDLSLQGSYLSGDVLRYLSTQFKNANEIDYELYAFAIMPNHVHLLLKPLLALPPLMKKLKGNSAKNINSLLATSGHIAIMIKLFAHKKILM